jgi:hypothetical protein
VQGPTTRRRIRLALKTAFVLMLWLPATLYVIAWSSTRLARDFGITDASPYATAVRQIERGESMYDPLPSPGPHRMGPHYLYPPVLAPLLSWGPDGNARAVQQLAYLLSMGGLVLFVLGITRLAAGPVSIVAPMLLFLLMKWKPRHLDAGLGEPLVVRFRPRRGGPRTRLAFALHLLALAAAFKVTPAWAALTLAIRAVPCFLSWRRLPCSPRRRPSPSGPARSRSRPSHGCATLRQRCRRASSPAERSPWAASSGLS